MNRWMDDPKSALLSQSPSLLPASGSGAAVVDDGLMIATNKTTIRLSNSISSSPSALSFLSSSLRGIDGKRDDHDDNNDSKSNNNSNKKGESLCCNDDDDDDENMDKTKNSNSSGSNKEEGSNDNNNDNSNNTTLGLKKNSKSIQRLPQHVVDRIAAGEVVQRPAAAAKELLENCLDAKSTHIVIHVEQGGLSKLMISDNGCGISPDDLALAATRFCTSKLTCERDLDHLQTFGFRGEALASLKTACRVLTITSRVSTSSCAYQLQYVNNGTTTTSTSSQQPKPCARPVGTTITCQDMFYNLPQRRQSLARDARAEYHRILQVAQYYAIHYASRGVTMVCQYQQEKKNNKRQSSSSKRSQSSSSNNTCTTIVDLNTSNCGGGGGTGSPTNNDNNNDDNSNNGITKKVLAQVLDPKLEHRLLTLECSSSSSSSSNKDDDNNNVQDGNVSKQQSALPDMLSNKPFDATATTMSFHCTGLISDPSYHESSSTAITLILFVNDRLVDCPTLKRVLEQAFVGTTTSTTTASHNNTPKGQQPQRRAADKPVLYLSLRVPPTHVDVNVHPTKRLVTLLFMDDICIEIHKAVKNLLVQHQQQQSSQHGVLFSPASVATSRAATIQSTIQNPYLHNRSSNNKNPKRHFQLLTADDDHDQKQMKKKRRNNGGDDDDNADDEEGDDDDEGVQSNEDEEDNDDDKDQKKQLGSLPTTATTKRTATSSKPGGKVVSTAAAAPPPPTKLPPSKLIRTSKAAPSGAIEPFLVRTQRLKQPQLSSQTPAGLNQEQQSESLSQSHSMPSQQEPPPARTVHEPGCQLLPSGSDDTSTTIDMTQPGAFAIALRNSIICSCPPLFNPDGGGGGVPPPVTIHQSSAMKVRRPSRVIPTPCTLASIQSLRKHVTKNTCPTLSKSIRDAIFCGVVSQHRSLVQCGTELILWNHHEMAQELFYQLALAKFGSSNSSSIEAKLGAPIDIQIIIAQALEWEEQQQQHEIIVNNNNEIEEMNPATLGLLNVSDTNEELARQAATCLLGHAEMLLEYFSIRIEQRRCDSPRNESRSSSSTESSKATSTASIVITGLPVLLEGHAPPPHGLAVFLLRLATEVDWNEELPCLQGICRELGMYYAQMPMTTTTMGGHNIDNIGSDATNVQQQQQQQQHYIQHVLFPAISYLLIPPKHFGKDGSVSQLTTLPVLYKVFERC